MKQIPKKYQSVSSIIAIPMAIITINNSVLPTANNMTEFSNSSRLEPESNFFYQPTVIRIMIWFGVTLLGAAIARLTLISVKCRHCGKLSDSFVVTSEGDYDVFQIQHRSNRTSSDIFRDVTTIVVNALLQFYFADVVSRISLESRQELWYLIPFVLSIVGFGVMGELRGLQTSISPSSIAHWTRLSWITYLTAFGIVLANLGYNIYRSIEPKETFYYLFSMVAIASYYGLVYVLWFRQTGTIHLHHWWICLRW